MSDEDRTPIVPHDVAGISAELRAVHREVTELRRDIRGYRDESGTLRQDVATVITGLAVAQRDITAAHRRIDAIDAEHAASSEPWRGVLPAVVVAVIVGALSLLGQLMIDRPHPTQTTEVHP